MTVGMQHRVPAEAAWRAAPPARRPLDSAAAQQALVDAHFATATATTYWQAIYRSADVAGAVIRDRRAAVLALADALALPCPSRILEIGCGAGSTAVALAQRGHHVQAIDTVGSMIDLTRAAAVEAKVEGRLIAALGDVHHLDFRAGIFDLVLAVGLTAWLDALAAPLGEIARVLQPGGHLIITADNRRRLSHLLDPRWFPPLAPLRSRTRAAIDRLRGRTPARPRLRAYARGVFDAALSDAGLRKVSGRTLGFGPFSFLGCPLVPAALGVRLHRRLQRLADRGVPLLRSGGAHYIVVAQKAGDIPNTEKTP